MAERKRIVLDASPEEADWIKTIVGPDGKTARERDLEAHDEASRMHAEEVGLSELAEVLEESDEPSD